MKKRSIERLKILFFLFFTVTANAQTEDVYVPDSLVDDSIPNRDTYQVVIPYYQYKSPEAAAFRKYGEYAVNEYTGNPNISIPIYTLSYKDIEIPIILSYDASGIKVDQEASWVGLGWNLMVGGCINYVTAGDVDPRTLNTNASDWEQFASQGNGDINTFTSNLVIENNGQTSQNYPIRDDLTHGYGETDYFSANFLGQTLLFMYDRSTNQYRIIGNGSDVYKIEDTNHCSYANIDNAEWKITDGNGTQYFFMQGEVTNGTSFQSIYTSAWYLHQIITPEGSRVNFSYTSDIYDIPCRARMYEQNDFVTSYEIISFGQNGDMVSYPGHGYNSSLTTSTYYMHARYLSSITTSSETITFTLGSRTDLTNARKLDKITIHSNISNQTVKEYQFNYSYFTASTVGGDMLTGSTGSFSYDIDKGQRLKLTSIDEKADQITLSTSFEYNEKKLPLKTSAAKDFWGYYNGKENYINGRLTLLPTPKYLMSQSDTYLTNEVKAYSGANRYCNKDSIQAAVLNKIIYPTKGYTMFVFEPHQFVSSQYPETGFFLTNHYYKYLSDHGNSPTSNPSAHDQFTMNGNASGSITLVFSGTLSTLYTNNAHVSIIPQNPNIGTTQTFDLSLATEYQRAYDSYFTKTIQISLPATSYTVSIYCPKIGSSYYVSATLDLTALPEASNVPVSTGGGLRIKRIENYNHDNALLDSTAYHYLDTNGNCSGQLLHPMLLYEKKEIIRIVTNNAPNNPSGRTRFDILRLKQSSSAMTAFSQALSGGIVGYSSVIKETYNAQGNRQISVESSYLNNMPLLYYSKYYYGTDYNGNILSQTIRNAVNNPLLKVENSYGQTTSTFGHILLMEDRVIYEHDALYNASDFPRYQFWHFPFKYKWNKLLQTTTTTYDGTNTQVKTTSYDYNTTNHHVWKETSNSSDSNITYITEYKYPCDYPTEHPCSLMCNSTNFMLYPVIEQSLSATVNGSTSLIKKRKDTYTAYNRKWRDALYDSCVFLPTATSFALNGGSLEQRLTYEYNDKCDRISVTKDTEKVTYLWAYNYMYPVAEIRGATYSDLTGWGLTTQMSNLATMTNASNVLSALATIRSSLASRPVLMTSYTYDPLIGITSMTTPNGTKTTYNYDVMGRLSSVQNHGNNTVQQHSYHYK